jgi:exodeoxyribonuclease V beta subunit
LHIGFGDIAKQNRKNEELEEWRRLFYVDFTRASSILVLPQYKKWAETDSNDKIKYPEFSFLKDAMEKIASTAHPLPSDTEWNPDDMYKKVKKILKKADFDVKNDEKLQNEIDARKAAMSSLQSTLTSKAILQYSYSSLASRVAKPDAENKTDDNEIGNVDESRADKDDSPLESPAKTKEEQKKIDPDVVLNDAYDSVKGASEPLTQAEEKYPRGAKIGNVLHNTLEKSEFENFGDLDAKFEEWRKNVPAKLKNIIKEEFGAESLPLAAHEGEWMEITLRYLFNTLHAALPVIAGSEFVKTEEPFHLVELDENAHKPEVQFGLNADVKNESTEAFATLHRVCKGFIDLLFVRGEGDNKRYSILDWKSDLLDDYSPKSVKEKVDEEYSVQRVLYSYCLIKWLKNFEFCKGMSEQVIFDKHFGGIYYAFLRGTDGKTDKGIYAQTWKDYDALKSAYERVKDLMKQEKK